MVLTGGPDCPAGPAGPAGPSSPFTPAGPRSPLAPGWPSAPCREEQWRGQHLGMLSCCLVRICVYDIERWLAAVLQGVQRIRKIQQVQPLHAHPVDNKQTVMKTERTAHSEEWISSSCVNVNRHGCGKKADMMQDVSHSYSQGFHEVQRVQQVRRNRPHPGGENSVFSLALSKSALF